jgi:8-oxo-dGTP pyrophosphatase MutT (NUDIX family)
MEIYKKMKKIYESDNIPYIQLKHKLEVFLVENNEDEKYILEYIKDASSVFCFVKSIYDDILVFEHSKDKNRKIDIPGGHVEDGENYYNACKREVLEETGFDIVDLKILGYKKIEILEDLPKLYKYKKVSYMVYFKAIAKGKINEILFEDSNKSYFARKIFVFNSLKEENSCFLSYI